jgi:hypothetical protein
MVGSGEEDDPPGKRSRWSWAGATIFVIAVCLSVSWGTALVMSASSRTPPISDTTSDLLLAVGGVLAGAITAYIGGYVSNMRHRHREDKSSDDD